jgi:hypothetical protein
VWSQNSVRDAPFAAGFKYGLAMDNVVGETALSRHLRLDACARASPFKSYCHPSPLIRFSYFPIPSFDSQIEFLLSSVEYSCGNGSK